MALKIQDLVGKNNAPSLHEQMGYAVQCMLLNRNYSLYPVLSLQIWTEHAILHRQIKFLFDMNGSPLAYLTWAYLRNDTVERLLNDPQFRLHPSEWDEGGEIWILDFCCKPGYGREVIKYLRNTITLSQRNVKWLTRRKKVRRLFINNAP
ncbi:toxin-activating lysine-acyltransferase (plasmid) [Pantoea agglomerans]|uniref:toxin-activating lysine-acyltransferase n=1 Tax=Pantoea TaxID=53335 RepID=UPI001781683F|nr:MULTISPECIES: toxin-activating lysine-acyltransferase [Pantoea]WVL92133.1 toxin-activating lysine-acyltransferase [Pantoea agglomerans]